MRRGYSGVSARASGDLDLRGLLVDLSRADCDFVVIGSSALAIQGWDVVPTDLDLFTVPSGIERIRKAIGVPEEAAEFVFDGGAQRFECMTTRGPVDVYLAVSGGLSYDEVRAEAASIHLGEDDLRVAVGRLEHVRDMRSAVGRPAVPEAAVAPGVKPGALAVIAIDGPAGAGKSTVARAIARRLGADYLNTGAMYRCVALAILRRGVDPDDTQVVARIAEEAAIEFREDRVFLDGKDVTEAIRRKDVTIATSYFAAFPELRAALVHRQRALFASGLHVVEGRDTGTVVVPDAPLKVFLTASPRERARRRALETGEDEKAVQSGIEDRDRLDSERRLSALRVADDAVVVDTTARSVQDVVDEIGSLAEDRGVAQPL